MWTRILDWYDRFEKMAKPIKLIWWILGLLGLAAALEAWIASLSGSDRLWLTAFLCLAIGYSLVIRSIVRASKAYRRLLPLYQELKHIETTYAPWKALSDRATEFDSDEKRMSFQWEVFYSDWGSWMPDYNRQAQLIDSFFKAEKPTFSDLPPHTIAALDAILPSIHPSFRDQYRRSMLYYHQAQLQIVEALDLMDQHLRVLAYKGKPLV